MVTCPREPCVHQPQAVAKLAKARGDVTLSEELRHCRREAEGPSHPFAPHQAYHSYKGGGKSSIEPQPHLFPTFEHPTLGYLIYHC